MKYITLVIILFLAGCGGNGENLKKDEWYVGGNLHNKDVSDWKKATEENKLATCADFAASKKEYSDNFDQLKIDATEIMNCINEATRDSGSDGFKVAEIAASCTVLLNN